MTLAAKHLLRPLALTAGVLLIPFVAMQFTREVTWSPLDFVTMGGLLLGTGLTYEWLASRAGGVAYRLAAGVAVGTGLLLVWVNLAVGIIGSEHNALNLLYLGVLAVALMGGVAARFRPRGLARAMAATALAQVLVGGVALLAGPGGAVDAGVVLGATALFAGLWLVAALLFWRAAQPAPGC